MISELDWSRLLADLGLVLAAFTLALPIGWERDDADRPAGLRTFPLVGLASCTFMLLGLRAFPDSPDAQARILQGLITGIGFIGGGAILKDGSAGHVRGIATATSIWSTGAIGAAVALGRLELGALLSLMNFMILRWIRPLVDRDAEECD